MILELVVVFDSLYNCHIGNKLMESSVYVNKRSRGDLASGQLLSTPSCIKFHYLPTRYSWRQVTTEIKAP